MRFAAGLIFASAGSLCVSGSAWSQTAAPKPAAAPQAPAPQAAPARAPAAQAPAAPAAASNAAPAPLSKAACTNPDALGIARTVEIDTTGGPGLGFEHF